MPVRTADAHWEGSLQEGDGTYSVESGAAKDVKYTSGMRFRDDQGSNPEELLGAAHAACYSMALSADLGRAGYTPDSINTTARVHLNKTDAGWRVQKIELFTKAKVPGIDVAEFQKIAEGTKTGCPVSNALSAVNEIILNAQLET